MGNMNVPAHITLYRKFTERELLPDTCQLIPETGANPVISGPGVISSTTPVAKTWRTKTSIPCRLDTSRAFRPGRLKDQLSEIDEYVLNLPYDAPVEPDDRVVLVDGRYYQVMKVTKNSEWTVTIECTVEEIGVEYDNS